MLNLGTDVNLGVLDQILQIPSGISSSARRTPSHRHSQFSFRVVHLGAFDAALVASIAVDDLLITMQQIGSWHEDVHICGRGHHQIDQS